MKQIDVIMTIWFLIGVAFTLSVALFWLFTKKNTNTSIFKALCMISMIIIGVPICYFAVTAVKNLYFALLKK